MYRLHCFGQSGNSFKVAFLLRALDLPFEPVYVDFFNGVTRDPAWRDEHNEMGEAPLLEDGELRLTQSGAILTYLAKRHGKFGGASEAEQLEVLRWLLFDNHKFTNFFATYRFIKSFGPAEPDPVIMKWLLARIEAAFGVVDKHLATREYMLGASPTIAVAIRHSANARRAALGSKRMPILRGGRRHLRAPAPAGRSGTCRSCSSGTG